MSARSRFSQRLPFGIGTVVGVLCAVLVVAAGVVLAVGDPQDREGQGFGLLRDYRSTPSVAWTLSRADLPDYESEFDRLSVVDSAAEKWLLTYSSGSQNSYLVVDRLSGKRLWDKPVDAGMGSCALNATGLLGCVVRGVEARTDGFYVYDHDGTIIERTDLADSARVWGVGDDFLRADQAGYRATLRTASGRELWGRTFPGAVIDVDAFDRTVIVGTADGLSYALDAADGTALVTCGQCRMQHYPSGIAVSVADRDGTRVSTYAIRRDRLDPDPVVTATGLRIVPGLSTLPVLTAADQSLAERARFEIRDPAEKDALWTISDSKLSKENARPCGELVALPRGDGSRTTFRLADGSRIGSLASPAPGAELDHNRMSCVGSTGDTLILLGDQQLAAFGTDGKVAWQRPAESARDLDGYLVITNGPTIEVLKPV